MDSMNRRDVLTGLAALAALGATGAEAQMGEDLSGSHVFRLSELEAKTSSNGGWSRAVTKGTLPTGEFVECHETMLPAGQMPHPPHKHPNTEFVMIREGKLQYIGIDGPDPKPIGPGDVIFTASNRLHGLKNIGDTPATYFVVSVSKQLPA